MCQQRPHIGMIRATFYICIFGVKTSHSLNIFLPLSLLLSFVVKQSHDTCYVTTAKLGSKLCCEFSDMSTMNF